MNRRLTRAKGPWASWLLGFVTLGVWLFVVLPAQASSAKGKTKKASAKKKSSAAAKAKKQLKAPQVSADPAHWFATTVGLIRVYQERPLEPLKGRKPKVEAPSEAEATAAAQATQTAGASCEVVESRAREGVEPGLTKESCTMIVGRMPKNASRLSYELRKQGIFMVKAESEGTLAPDAAPKGAPAALDRLLLPSPIARGKKWSEKRGKLVVQRQVKTAGEPCKAASRSFGDCLVLSVKETEKNKVKRSYTETYAAGVGLVEDGQWQLLDLKGL